MTNDFEEMLEQSNIQYAIVGEVNPSLKETLKGLTKTRTASLARAYQVPGRSKMKQAELAKAVQEYITDPAQLESILLILDAAEWAVFEAAYGDSFVQDNYLPYGYYRLMLELGIVFTYFNEGKLYLVMPDEVKEVFTKLNTPEFAKKRSKMALVFDYLLAMSNLYGIYTPDKLLEIYNGQNASDPLEQEELDELIKQFLQREQNFVLEEGYLINVGLVYNSEEGELQSLLQEIQGKPHYVPDKTELLKYADDGYFEMTPQLVSLKAYVLDRMSDDEEMVDALVDDIQLACSMNAPLDQLIYEFERRDLVFENPKEAERVIGLIVEISNHTRTWANCGHTLDELGASKLVSGQKAGGANAPVQSAKVGRNEPCPCGSGLKYKKCCGK
ncbi:SEC-C metal-binding domain-containing protein [Paenibacillus vini]|uniref:YecA family protein n=1 Tax=Paenibacillus vini TaxID=1476024 RepID=UPI0025B6D4D2|nr:SEC-C metal-binding domain-containing protein [Paenibacillus vini]MDN4066569.1 SEC-C metal-binding domain-containing protein [Paenibacillus vini]